MAGKTKPARDRGARIREARTRAKMTQAELGRLLGMTRENVAMIEAGKVGRLRGSTVRTLVEKLGLDPVQLTTDADILDFLDRGPPGEWSTDARRVVEGFDRLPPVLREYLLAHVLSYLELVSRQPILAQLLHDAGDSEAGKKHRAEMLARTAELLNRRLPD